MTSCATCSTQISRRNKFGLCQPCSARKTIIAVNAAALNIQPDAVLRRARTQSARRLSWCPPRLRPDYLKLLNKHYSAAEAREIILSQWDTDQARRRHAA